MAEPKNITQADTSFTVAEEENTNYEQINQNDPSKPRFLETTTLM